MADTRISSIFGAYAENIQALIDARADKFKKAWFPNYFDFGTKQMSLTYSSVVGRSRVEAAASIVTPGASAPLRGRMGLEKYSGKIYPIKVKRAMDENSMREYMTIQAMNLKDEVKKRQLLQLLWEDVAYCGNAIQDRLDILACQALSEGVITLDGTTNPDGYNATVDLLMPSTNKRVVASEWTVAHAASMTPLVDIKNAIAAGELLGISFEKILMPKALFLIFAACTEVTNALKGYYRVTTGGTIANGTLEQINTFLQANMLPVIEIVDVVKAIEKDGVIASLRPFTQTNCALVPAGKLGTIHNALAIEELKPVAGTTYATTNNALISKWGVNEPWAEFTKGELNGMPGLDAIDSIFIIQADTTA